jgi:class 3 adenylate cyclase
VTKWPRHAFDGARLADVSERGDERVGDAERQAVIDILRAHTGAGRLTLDEFSDRAGEVFAARTRDELQATLRDLPPMGSVAVPPSPGDPPPPLAVPVHYRNRFIAIMSGSHARGRWRPARLIRAFAFWGGVTIDLSEAQIDGPVLDIYAVALMGGVTVKVPAGYPVSLDGLVIMGGTTDRTKRSDPLPGAPLIRVHARGMWGGVEVRTARPPGSRRRDRHRAPGIERGPADRDEVKGALPPPSLSDLIPPVLGPEFAAWVERRTNGGRHGGPEWWRHPDAWGPPRGRSRDRSRERDRDARAGDRNGEADASPTAAPTPGPSGTLTMMVTDIAGSTKLAEILGDRRWIEVLTAHNDLVRAEVSRQDGTEIKTNGDGFLVVFASARRAILAAVGVQQALAGYRSSHPDLEIAVRIGLHTGEIVDVDGDVFGQNVVVAVRIADHAEPGEIMVSGLTRDLTLAGGDLIFGAGEEVELKGLSQPWRVHRVEWAPAAL